MSQYKRINLDLKSLFMPSVVRHFPQIDSTNTALKKHLRKFRPVIFLADFQTSGRGRQDKKWYSAAGESLMVSIPLKWPTAIIDEHNITYLIGFAVMKSLSEFGIDSLRIKWPNDIMLNDKKVAGILAERTIKSQIDIHNPKENPFIIVGVGINLHQVSFASQISNTATSVFLETGKSIDRFNLLKLIYQNLDQLLLKIKSGQPEFKDQMGKQFFNFTGGY